jgi:hypothetical protein
MANEKIEELNLPPFPKVELKCATSKIKIGLGVGSLCLGLFILCFHAIPVPDTAFWVALAAYTFLTSPRKLILDGEWLHVHWLAWSKSYYLSSLEGVYLSEYLDVTAVVACFRDKAPVLLPFWNRFPGARDDDKFRVAAHLSRTGARNSKIEAKSYEQGEITVTMHHNRVTRALFVMAIGILFAIAALAYYLYAYKWKITPNLFWAGPAVVVAAVLTIRYIMLFLRPGISLAINGARRLGRFGAEKEKDDTIQAALEAGDLFGLAVHPRLIIASPQGEINRVQLDGDFTSFFLALRLLQKWPEERFFKRVNVFHPKHGEDADDRLTREIRKKLWREVDALKKTRGGKVEGAGLSILKRGEPFHPLAHPDDLYDSVYELLGSE